MQIETEDQKWEQSNLLLTVCNGPREGGGFMIAPDAKIDDGLLHYAMIKTVSRPMMFRLIPEVMNGTHGRFKQVTMGSCKRMIVSADRPMYIHTDGEIYAGFGTDVRRVTFEVLPKALKVVRG
jgi:diacylglycerol kinase family enzyme